MLKKDELKFWSTDDPDISCNLAECAEERTGVDQTRLTKTSRKKLKTIINRWFFKGEKLLKDFGIISGILKDETYVI